MSGDDGGPHLTRPAHLRPGSWVAVGAGGALDTLARHGTDVLAASGSALTWSTAAVNLLGAFLLGLVLEIGTGHRAREGILVVAAV